MEINWKQQHQLGQEQTEASLTPDIEINEDPRVIPVVRTNTPRPLSFAPMVSHSDQEQDNQPNEPFPLPRFPSMAPMAPPLPEDFGEGGEATLAPTFTSPNLSRLDNGERDFIWLFEYGLEMDPAMLNSPERLHGMAMLYGAAVLRSNTLVLGTVEWKNKQKHSKQTVATIIYDPALGAEVWGVLYRLPRYVTEHVASQPSLLDTIHFAGTAQSLFCATQVAVYDPHRKREITCIVYIATEYARQQIAFVPIGQATDTQFIQRLTELAKKYKFPDRYLGIHPYQQAGQAGTKYAFVAAAKPSLNTDPLLVLKEQSQASALANALPETPLTGATPHCAASAKAVPGGLLIAFAIYLIVTLLAGLIFAVLQSLGFAQQTLNTNFTLLGVPWLVMFYGLLGGCISCITMLVRYRAVSLPHFVIISWFARPYIATILAAIAYLLLNSGMFALRLGIEQNQALFLLVGAFAGLCEGWIFFRWQ